MKNKPAILCILDGWGIRGTRKANAVVLGKTPNYDYLIKNFPNSKSNEERYSKRVLSIGLTKKGNPRHPLYMPNESFLKPFRRKF